MKAILPMAVLAFAAALPLAQAQSETSKSCADCKVKEEVIAGLRAELAALKPTPVTEPSSTEPVAAGEATYTVVAGDGFMRIANKTGCKAEDIAAVNGMTLTSVIKTGQVLKLPAGATVAPPAEPATTPPTEPAKLKSYTIQEGDTYYSIARDLGIPMNQLIAANPKIKATSLYKGRVIKLPAVADAASANVADDTAAESNGALTGAVTGAIIGDQAAEPAPAPQPEKKIRSITVDQEISYSDFAAKYGTTIERLNSLNDLSLTSNTILAKGSELYVPAQP